MLSSVSTVDVTRILCPELRNMIILALQGVRQGVGKFNQPLSKFLHGKHVRLWDFLYKYYNAESLAGSKRTCTIRIDSHIP